MNLISSLISSLERYDYRLRYWDGGYKIPRIYNCRVGTIWLPFTVLRPYHIAAFIAVYAGWNDMITVYGIETYSLLLINRIPKCVGTIWLPFTVLRHAFVVWLDLRFGLERYDYRLRYWDPKYAFILFSSFVGTIWLPFTVLRLWQSSPDLPYIYVGTIWLPFTVLRRHLSCTPYRPQGLERYDYRLRYWDPPPPFLLLRRILRWNDMITVYGIETLRFPACRTRSFCWNDMITVYGIETFFHGWPPCLADKLERYDYRLRYWD